MEPYYQYAGITIYHGDCRDVVPCLPESPTACVSDPPYGLSFMGKGWDHAVPGEDFWRPIFAALVPGATCMAFGGTRTFHRLACAIEDAGFEIRDCLSWLYGSGFPKSLDVSKAIDKAAGAAWEQVAATGGLHKNRNLNDDGWRKIGEDAPRMDSLQAATPEAALWNGYGTALKPSWEPVILARKPLVGTVEANCREHGTGALNIDGCRIGPPLAYSSGGFPERTNRPPRDGREEANGRAWARSGEGVETREVAGRWPANLILDEEAAAQLGGASRFFYCAKASKKDRGEGNDHPTVKPVELMRWLIRLVTMPSRTLILDPFMGSGSTLVAARAEHVNAIGIEIEEHYCEIAAKRLAQEVLPFG